MKRLHELCLRLMDGELPPAEAEELDAIIAADPAAEARFLELMDLHHGLIALAPETPDTRRVMQRVWRSEASAALRSVRSRVRRRRSRPRTSVLPLALAAVALVAVGLVTLAVTGRDRPVAPITVPVAEGPIESPATDAAVARAQFADGGERRLEPGSRIAVDQPTRVHRLADATVAALEPGAVLVIDGAASWTLVAGRGSWSVAAQAPDSPYVVALPHGRVTVLGTAFDLEATPGWSEIRMLSGRVSVRASGSGETRELAAGETLRLDVRSFVDPDPALLAAWDFTAEAAPLVDTRSGWALEPEAPERIELGSAGLRLREPVRLVSREAGAAISRAIRERDAFSVVLRLVPDTGEPDFDIRRVGAARILSLSTDSHQRNLTIGQGEMRAGWEALSVRLRHAGGHSNGLPAVVVPGGMAGAVAFDLLVSYDRQGGLRIYRDGSLIEQRADLGSLVDWSGSMPLVIGGEIGVPADEMRPWTGTIQHLRIFDRAMAPQDLQSQDE